MKTAVRRLKRVVLFAWPCHGAPPLRLPIENEKVLKPALSPSVGTTDSVSGRICRLVTCQLLSRDLPEYGIPIH